jgi:hypothetical protein
LSADQSQPQTVPGRTSLAGMRVCRRPARCPYVAPERSLAADLATWQRALDAALPGDSRLVSALLGDIAGLAIPPVAM